MKIIEVKHLTKTFKVPIRDSGLKNSIKSFFKRKYNYIEAVDDISFSIKKGEIVGYIGPNGAGKSTTIKMLCGILKPDSGTITVNNMNPYKERKNFVKDIGVVFGQRSQLWWDIPVEDSFDLLKDIYNIESKKYLKTKKELVDLLEIKDIIKMPVRKLSLGQRMKCEIVASLLHNPKILFLDEPTIGLDAISKENVRQFIKKINQKKKVTVILTTHDMHDLEALANRIILIGKGKKLYDGNLSEIKDTFNSYKIVKIKSDNEIKEITNENITLLSKINNEYTFKLNTNKIKLTEFIQKLSKYNIEDIDVDNESIDSIIVKLYEEYHI